MMAVEQSEAESWILPGHANAHEQEALLPYKKVLLDAVTAGGQRATLDSLTPRTPDVLNSVRQAIVHDAVNHRSPAVAEDLVQDARSCERGRQGRRLLPERGPVQMLVLDTGLPGCCEPRRRHVAGLLGAQEVEPNSGEEDR